MNRLLQAIQVRKLDRLAAAYAVAAWLLVQAASIALPTFDAPAWSLKALILLALLGFPAVLTVGWMGARHLPGAAIPRPRHAPIHLATLAVLASVLLIVVGEAVYHFSGVSAGRQGIRKTSSTALRPAATSIAVLPFVNMTGDARQDYFADGMSEELIGDLASNPQLRVVARASSFAFKGKNQDVKTIAGLLAVLSIVEGSVREAGQHLRIHAELIDPQNGYDLWSSSFDRQMTNALAVQDEIAGAIAKALTHRLLPRRARARDRTFVDPQAYRDYLAAQYDLAPRTRSGGEQAVALFQKAVGRQPNLVEAYVGLARALILMADYPNHTDAIPSAERAVARGLSFDPQNLDALGLHLDLAMRRLDWNIARADAQRMLILNPHSQAVLHELFRYYQFMGFPEEALHAAQGAAQLNRLSIVDRMNVTAALAHLALWKETIDAGEGVLKLYPDQPALLVRLCNAYAHTGSQGKAHEIEAQLVALHETGSATMCDFDIATGSGNRQQALAILGKWAADFPHGDLGAFDIADNYAIAGDYPEALRWLDRCYDSRDFMLFVIRYDRAIAPAFFQTAGWEAFWHRPLIKQWQAAHDQIARDLAARPSG